MGIGVGMRGVGGGQGFLPTLIGIVVNDLASHLIVALIAFDLCGQFQSDFHFEVDFECVIRRCH